MITQETKRFVQVEGVFAKSEFTIRPGKKAFKTLISNLYTDKVKAVLCELSANCFDSHVAAGCPEKPFEVTLPTHFEPNFIIRDFGTGLSEEFMMESYTVAFLSSKDNSNAYNGEKGLGRLSALSICDSYICVSVQDGVKKTYSVFYNEEGIPTILSLGSETTDEPNGFLVNIPVSAAQVAEFENKAKQVYRPYKVKPIITNHENFDIASNKYILLADDGSWGLKGAGSHAEALCSVYSYPIEPSSIPNLTQEQSSLLNCGVVIHFDIGEINSAANREGLDYDANTIHSIKTKLNKIWAETSEQLKKDFEGKTVFEKMALSNSLFAYNGKLHGLNVLSRNLYKNLNLPNHLVFNNFLVRSFCHDYRKGATEENGQSYQYADNLVFFYIDKKSFLKNKAKKFFQDGANYGKRMICLLPRTETAVAEFQNVYGVDVSKFTPTSSLTFDAPLGGVRSKKVKNQFHVYIGDRYESWNKCWDKTIIEEDEMEDVYFIQRHGYTVYENRSVLRRMINLWSKLSGRDITLVGLSEREQKNYPNIPAFRSNFQKFISDWLQTKADIQALRDYYNKNYSGFKVGVIKCLDLEPQTLAAQILAEHEELHKKLVDNSSDSLSEAQSLCNVGIPKSTAVHGFTHSNDELLKKYPLLSVLNISYGVDKVVATELSEYINKKG